MPRKISPFIREQVRRRANFLCEYCHTDERWQLVPFTIDHVIPTSEGGTDTLDNYALACFHCNRRKSNKQFVEQNGERIALFNPRQMTWAENFIWSANGLQIVPLTEIGVVTIELFDLNRERILAIRQADISVKRHPPADDPIQD